MNEPVPLTIVHEPFPVGPCAPTSGVRPTLTVPSGQVIVAPAEMHVVPEVERVVEQRERYWVVEKQGEAAEVAEELDIR